MKSREDGKVRMRLSSGANQEAIANVVRTRCDSSAVEAGGCKTDVNYAVARIARTARKSGVKVGRVATAANRRQTASQRCGGMRGWAALSSHRTSDVPVSGCAIGERMHVGCSLAGGCVSSRRRGAAESVGAVRGMDWSRSG